MAVRLRLLALPLLASAALSACATAGAATPDPVSSQATVRSGDARALPRVTDRSTRLHFEDVRMRIAEILSTDD